MAMDMQVKDSRSHKAITAAPADQPITGEGHVGDCSNTSSWYAIQTKPRQESLAVTNLERQGFSCYLPLITLEKLRRGKKVMVEEAMFPGYLFIELDASGTGQSWAPIRSTFGVSKLVSFGGQPAKVDGRLISQLQNHEQSRFETPTHLFNQGEKVVVLDGPFAGLEAIYQMDNAEQRCMVLLNMLSKQVPLQVDANNLRKVS